MITKYRNYLTFSSRHSCTYNRGIGGSANSQQKTRVLGGSTCRTVFLSTSLILTASCNQSSSTQASVFTSTMHLSKGRADMSARL